MSQRKQKVQELIKDLAAQYLQGESNKTSLITVTSTDISSDLKNSTVYVTIYPESGEESAMNFLKRKRKGFREFLKGKTNLRFLPFFDFEIDRGEKHRQRIDEISKKA